VATWFDQESNSAHTEVLKTKANISNPFGRKPVNDSRVISSSNINNNIPASSPVANKNDLDVPSFLRKKM
jgi:hypothetical protein